MAEIFWNDKLGDYTLEKEIDGVKSIKKKPIKYKENDSTSKFRKEILKKEIFK